MGPLVTDWVPIGYYPTQLTAQCISSRIGKPAALTGECGWRPQAHISCCHQQCHTQSLCTNLPSSSCCEQQKVSPKVSSGVVTKSVHEQLSATPRCLKSSQCFLSLEPLAMLGPTVSLSSSMLDTGVPKKNLNRI